MSKAAIVKITGRDFKYARSFDGLEKSIFITILPLGIPEYGVADIVSNAIFLVATEVLSK